MDLSVAIIARNKSDIFPSCLTSARAISGDVVIVTNSDHKFVNYSDQKNYAASKCKNDWILSLDSDEELSPELIYEFQTLDNQLFAAFEIPRLNIIFGRPIRHTNWDPNPIVRLYNKNLGKWVGAVHEKIATSGQVGQLKHQIIHHNYQTVEQFISKMNTYTSLESKTTNPFFDFLRRYFWHLGFLDGWHGLFLSYLMFIYHLVTWVKKNSSSS